ncbi:MAG: bifunctional [glutamine synthetase] adenylyltransferase/[glutamine synthetase]-adenylyl-L-tyrosine phosphorylase, partial [Xanthobacteraceae bacterium]
MANTAAAKAAVSEALASAPDDATARLAAVISGSERLEALLQGVFEGSPYLWGTIAGDPAMLLRLLEEEPEAATQRILTEYARAALDAESDADAQVALRAMKREGALLIALADIGGVWSLDEVTDALTRLADKAVRTAVDRLLLAAAKAGKIKLPNVENPGEGSGYIVLAMGKHGAGELNYSSDIDLIVFFERDAPLAEGVEPVQFFVGITKNLLKLVNERTADGYVFRTDLRLRPDPGSTQIAISTAAGYDYYEREGQTWERAAYIKARPVAGDLVAGEKFLKNISPFVWRRYLDHAAIAEVHAKIG